LDEERKPGLGGDVIDPGAPPSKLVSVRRRPGADPNGQAKTAGNLIQLRRADGPAEWLKGVGNAGRHPPPESVLGGRRWIDNGNQF
jgi:hypothetical protein